MSVLLSGILPPITTPFYSDGSIYFRKLQHNVERYSLTAVSGLVVQGSTGEAIFLSDQEKRDVLKCAIEFSAPEKVMIAGTGIESAIETLRLTEYAAELGYDAAMVRTPHYYKGQMLKPENMLAFFRTVADRAALPIVIYNFPQATGYDMPVELVLALSEHSNIIAIKESSGSVEKVVAMVKGTRQIRQTATVTEKGTASTVRLQKSSTAVKAGELVSAAALSGAATSSSSTPTQVSGQSKEVGFQVLVGAAHKLNPSLQAGAVGAILAFADIAPNACCDIYDAFMAGDMSLSEQRQQKIVEAATRIVGELSIPGVKYAMDVNGYFGGNPRLPLLPVNADQKREIEALLSDIKS